MVYFCGDELPTAIFFDEKDAEEYKNLIKKGKHWMDSEIVEVASLPLEMIRMVK
jgi:hypothetical protein